MSQSDSQQDLGSIRDEISHGAEGIVEDFIYLGELCRYKVKISDDHFLAISLSSDVDIKNFRRGDNVRVGWKWLDPVGL